MLLRSTPTSPFGRKAICAARYLGLAGAMQIVTADTLDPHDPLQKDNPLGKMPVLILDDGRRVYDSPVILEHLDHLAGGGRILPASWDDRLAALTQQALADGILDASLLVLYEGRRPAELQYEPWVERQRGKILRGLATLADVPPDPALVTVGTITIGCLFAYLDRRKPVDWRAPHPGLAAWFEKFLTATPVFAEVLG